VLSGGERNRYALARMLLHPSNFLLLDEPTNHLDLRAKDVLLESLKKFTGTVVFVSHDRYFIDKLATRIFEIGDGRIEVFPGNYEDYLWRKQGHEGMAPDLELAVNGRGQAEVTSLPASGAAIPDLEGQSASLAVPSQKRLNPIKLKQMKERCQELEEEIERLEAGIASTTSALQNFVSAEETKNQSDAMEHYRKELAARMAEWEELAAELELSE
jgi:ATP-binding cassette subfamily F protein 3